MSNMKEGDSVYGDITLSYIHDHAVTIENKNCSDVYVILSLNSEQQAMMDGFYWRVAEIGRNKIGYTGKFKIKGNIEKTTDNKKMLVKVTDIHIIDYNSLSFN